MCNAMKTELFAGITPCFDGFKPIREEVLEAMCTTCKIWEDNGEPIVNHDELNEVNYRPPRR